MELGVLGSFGDGMMQPLSMLVLGDIVNSYGGAGTADSAFSSSAVDKLPNVLANMTLFFGALVVSFVFAWRLALAGLPFTLLFVAPSVVLGKRMAAAAGEARAAYEEAGGVAEQAVSSIRTVVSYRGERQTLERFGRALARSTALGIKQGLIKGAVIGSLGIIEDGDGDPVGQRTLNVWRWRWRLSVEMQ
ncbi:ABC transporter B family member 15-like isoform X2 [Miscanthus floridulus]|uniref:ABC transporter B family member 15-like n=1 Tax=Miscanthus floridulus TaxID=154761 RepID=UPI00345AEAB4